jgi:hypothetical protein
MAEIANIEIPVREIVKKIGGLKRFAHQCHVASLEVIRTGLLPETARVARGWCPKVPGQHSWVVIGDPYRDDVVFIDPTLWSYTNTPPKLLVGLNMSDGRRPHGHGSIWDYGRPEEPKEEVIKLKAKLSSRAKEFLELAAPKGLDRRGWQILANSPVGGWPAKEIIGAMAKDKRLVSLIPIDIVGMLTDENPGNLYS